MDKTYVFIDSANLHWGAKEMGFSIDHKKFIGWLRQKFTATPPYLFIGYMEEHVDLYALLEHVGYSIVFKKTIRVSKELIKGNCDAELVLQAASDYYERQMKHCVIITGDGDFRCLVDFLKKKGIKITLLAPNRKKCSTLLKNAGVSLLFLNEHYHKFNAK